jgi:hypothetical protein
MNIVRLDHFDDLGCTGIWLGVEDMNARRAQARHDQITPLDVRMRRIGTKRGATRVPSEMMQLIAGVRHRDAVDELAILRRLRIEIDDAQRRLRSGAFEVQPGPRQVSDIPRRAA